MYKDRCTVYRREKSETEYGETVFGERIKVYENIAVALSYKNVGSIKQTNSVARTEKQCSLFTRPEVKILPNDIIEVETLGEVTEYIAGDCERHSSHNNVTLSKKVIEV